MEDQAIYPITLPEWYYNIKDPPTERNWNVFLIINENYSSPSALAQSIIYAKSFGAQLTICAPPEFNKDLLKKLINYINIEFKIPAMGLQLDMPMKEWLIQASSKYEAIFFVASFIGNKTSLGTTISQTLHFFRNSRVPLILVPNNATILPLDKIAFAMNFEKEEKEKILWGSYFARIANSQITVYKPKVKDQNYKLGIMSNFTSLTQLYDKLDLNYSIIDTDFTVYTIEQSSISLATIDQIGLYLIMVNKYWGAIDYIMGPNAKDLLKKTQIPIMCIPKRDDLYVLCS
ncbi:MAG: hypothetical protein PHF55_07320 [Bacteroidales bacterium]|nr:hypothetical protein [Bacteroidales bacterium]